MKQLVLGVCFSVLALPGAAHAQNAEAPETIEARRAYEAGASEYEAGRYDAAHGHFLRAYELTQLAPLLFNAATTLDRLFRFGDALSSYRAYLEHEGAQHAEYARARIRVLEQRMQTPNQISREPEALAALDPLPASLRAPPPSQLPPILMMIGGGAVALASMGPGLRALSIRGDLRDRCEGGVCTEADRSDADKMDRLALTSDLLLAAGVGVAVGGLIWFFVRRGDSGDEAPVAMSCTGDGCMTQANFSF